MKKSFKHILSEKNCLIGELFYNYVKPEKYEVILLMSMTVY